MKKVKDIQKAQPRRRGDSGSAGKAAKAAGVFIILAIFAVIGYGAVTHYGPGARLQNYIAENQGKSVQIDKRIALYQRLLGVSNAALGRYFDYEDRLEAGDAAGAAQSLDKAIGAAPEMGMLYLNRALLRRQADAANGAENADTIVASLTDLSTAIEKAPEEADPYFFRGMILLRFNNSELAGADFDKASALVTPADMSVASLPLFQVGIFARNNDLNGMVKAADNYLAVNPHDTRVEYLRGKAKEVLKRKEAAAEIAKAAEVMGPEGTAAIDSFWNDLYQPPPAPPAPPAKPAAKKPVRKPAAKKK